MVFVVDPNWDCVESYVAHVPLLQQHKIIKVMTRLGKSAYCNSDRADIYKTITYNSWTRNPALATEEICPQLLNMDVTIAAVIPTFDPAVYLADQLAACIGVRGNPSKGPLADARWNKWEMSEAVKRAGLRSVNEKRVSTWEEAKDYMESLSPPLSTSKPVIFKILEGSSSRGVMKIHSLKQAEEVWNSAEYVAVKSILIQECFMGKEYVIDSASRDGVHKIVMVYHEDLRPGNGIWNLYYGFKTMDPEDPKTKIIMDYHKKVLDATGLQNGACDMEVFWIEDEGQPCVTDLNARWSATMWHDGLKLEQELAGHDQITATINAYLDSTAFNELPAVPSLKKNGALVFSNVFHTGILKSIPALAVAEKMPSYLSTYKKDAVVGQEIKKFTAGQPPITILLANTDKTVLDADYEHLIDLEYSNDFFDITPSTGDMSLTALRPRSHGLRSQRLPVIATLAVLAVATVLALVAMSQRKVPDGTEYITIE